VGRCRPSNGDGKSDLVVANRSSNNLSILLGNATALHPGGQPLLCFLSDQSSPGISTRRKADLAVRQL